MTPAAQVLADLESLSWPTTIVVVAAYPRDSHTGLLSEIGTSLDLMEEGLSRHLGGLHYRLLHGISLILLPHESVDCAQHVQAICRRASTSLVETRTLMLQIESPRSEEWLDELIGDLSLRSNFGNFSREKLSRLIDGEPTQQPATRPWLTPTQG